LNLLRSISDQFTEGNLAADQRAGRRIIEGGVRGQIVVKIG
jgi:hypothetical protein